MRHVWLRAIFAGPLVIALLALVHPAEAGKKDDTLNIATNQEITNVDKYFNASRVGTWIQHLGGISFSISTGTRARSYPASRLPTNTLTIKRSNWSFARESNSTAARS